MNKIILITGVAGQDGSYMADLCLRLGYEVHGLARHSQFPSLDNIKHLIPNRGRLDNRFYLHLGDVLEANFLNVLVKKVRPNIIFNFAALSHVGVSFEMPSQTFSANTIGFLNIINAALISFPEAKIYQASSSELLGNTTKSNLSNINFSPESPYAVSKLASHHLSILYGKQNNLKVTQGILFNHESFRRSNQFVTKKIILGAASIANNLKTRTNKASPPKLLLGNLHAKRDWGWAPEYMLGILQHTLSENGNTLVIGTGESASVLDFAQRAFRNFGLDSEEWIDFDPNLLRANEVNELEANLSDVQNSMGWVPRMNWKNLCDLMSEEVMAGKEKEVKWQQMITERGLPLACI